MKRIVVVVFILFISKQLVIAQAKKNKEIKNTQFDNIEHVENVIYFSVGGPSYTIISVHYEHKIAKQLWGRVGLGYSPFVLRGATLPLGIQYLKGSGKSYFELGLGTTIIYTQEDLTTSLFNSKSGQVGVFLGVAGTAGYRYQPKTKNIFFKIAVSPIYVPYNSEIIPFMGLSFGYSF